MSLYKSNNVEVVPFGKYKGQPVEVLANDKEYCDWLMSQGDFLNRYSNIKTLIINNFKEPEDTPDHNRIQGLFLDENFCRKIGSMLVNFDDEKREKKYKEYVEMKKRNAIEEIASIAECHPYEDQLRDVMSKIDSFDGVAPVEKVSRLRFEENGKDVSFCYSDIYERITFDSVEGEPNDFGDRDIFFKGLDINVNEEYSYCYLNESLNVLIEIKPSIGDDYPSIMRQMQANECNVLFYESYNGVGVSEENFRKMFDLSKIKTIRLDEVL